MTPANVIALATAIRAAATEELVGAGAFEKIIRAADGLPPLHGGVSVERHLGPGQQRVDLLVRALHSDASTLARLDLPALTQPRRFSAWWSTAPGASGVRYADLEFDLKNEATACFVGPMIEPELPMGMDALRHAMAPAGTARARFAFALQVLEATDPEPHAGCPASSLRACFDELPGEGFIGHAGSLRTRMTDGTPLVRLIVSMRRSDLEGYLRRLAWPGALASLQLAADRYLEAAERIDLDLDMVAAGLASEVGFCRTFWDGGLTMAPLRRCLARMESAGLVTSAQARGITAFATSDLWLSGLPRTITVKIKVHGDGRQSAKVYLSLLRMA